MTKLCNKDLRPIAIIPARAGSKRLPGKNTKILCGQPMLSYTVQAALDSGIFEGRVYVSTEDEDIAKLAESSGATPYIRPLDLAGDMVSATDVCLDLCKTLHDSSLSTAVVCLQPTSPLRNAHDIHASWRLFQQSGAEYLVSVTPIDPHYFHWAMSEKPGGWGMYFGDLYLMERPLLPPVYRPNGAIKIARLDALRVSRNFFGSNLQAFPMPELRSVHVAELFDFEIAECLIRKQVK